MRTNKWIKKHYQDLSKKSYLITGANSGIGFEAARILASYGAHVILACRNQGRAEVAKAQIIQEYSTAKIDILIYDQASFSSINHAVTEIKLQYPDLDGYVFNAGVYHPDARLKTAEGFPLTIGTNYLGLAYFLRSLIKSNAFPTNKECRLVFVGSLVWWDTLMPLNFDHTLHNSYRLQRQYDVSKTLIGRMVYELIQHHQLTDDLKLPATCKVYAMHPGVSGTGIVNSKSHGFSERFSHVAHFVLYHFVHQPDKASLGIIRLLSEQGLKSKEFMVPRGLFHISGFPKKNHIPANLKRRNRPLIKWTLAQLDKHEEKII